jgi:hypothetical protein
VLRSPRPARFQLNSQADGRRLLVWRSGSESLFSGRLPAQVFQVPSQLGPVIRVPDAVTADQAAPCQIAMSKHRPLGLHWGKWSRGRATKNKGTNQINYKDLDCSGVKSQHSV